MTYVVSMKRKFIFGISAAARICIIFAVCGLALWSTTRIKRNTVDNRNRVKRLPVATAQRVAGESFYQDGIVEWVQRNGQHGSALLIPEPDNRHSPSGMAVRIDLAAGGDHVTCGYLPERVAPEWCAKVQKIQQSGAWAYCDIEILGDWESDYYFRVRIVPAISK